MSYNLLSDCLICDLQLLVVLTASERHSAPSKENSYSGSAERNSKF